MDLLTVIMHEIGHVLGLPDEDAVTHAHDLMAATLDAGVRRLVETSQVLPDAVAPYSTRTASEPDVPHIEWAADAQPAGALVYDAETGTFSAPSAPLAPVAEIQVVPMARRHTARIVWEHAAVETLLAEHESHTHGPWWRRLQRLFRHGQRAAGTALTTGRG
jgi:hypothetical protein